MYADIAEGRVPDLAYILGSDWAHIASHSCQLPSLQLPSLTLILRSFV